MKFPFFYKLIKQYISNRELGHSHPALIKTSFFSPARPDSVKVDQYAQFLKTAEFGQFSSPALCDFRGVGILNPDIQSPRAALQINSTTHTPPNVEVNRTSVDQTDLSHSFFSHITDSLVFPSLLHIASAHDKLFVSFLVFV